MRGVGTVFRKEVRESLRDRRTVFTALVMGPVFGPLLLAALLQFIVSREEEVDDRPLELAVAHAERAPNLVEHLTAAGAAIKRVAFDDAAARRAVRAREHRLVLAIPADFGTRLAAALPAPLQLYYDGADIEDGRRARRVSTAIAEYGQTIAQGRLVLRGVDPRLLVPVALQNVDLSTPRSRSELILSMLSYIVIFAMLAGGMYLAIDATAGERERGSLEPLLTTPVSRSALVYGKILATCTFMLASLALTVTTIAIAMSQVRLEGLGVAPELGPAQALRMIVSSAPLIPLGAALMTLIASFTRSYREAQSWLAFALLVPTLPLLFASLLNLKPSLVTMAVPSLSQHFLLMAAVSGERLPLNWALLSAAVSLSLGALI
ncbi:MAG: ABC transporter permease subunit, partial [Steroidobacteraceae bacterium]|nr:ABC transporter permease subunit [Steroidobacteraceae bacterium]